MSLNNFPWLLKSAECFYHTQNTRIQYIGDKCRVSDWFSVVGVHCQPLVHLPLAVTEHISIATISRSIFVVSRPFSQFLSQFLGIQVIPDSVPSHLSRSIQAYSQRLLVLLDQEYYFTDWKVAVYLVLLRNWLYRGAPNHSHTHCLDCCVATLIA